MFESLFWSQAYRNLVSQARRQRHGSAESLEYPASASDAGAERVLSPERRPLSVLLVTAPHAPLKLKLAAYNAACGSAMPRRNRFRETSDSNDSDFAAGSPD